MVSQEPFVASGLSQWVELAFYEPPILMSFKQTCWVAYVYRGRYCSVPTATYIEAVCLLNSLAEKSAVEPLGIYRINRRRFQWHLRDSYDSAGIQRQHEGAILEEMKRLTASIDQR